MKKTIRVGSRDSLLAVAQTKQMLKRISEKHPEISFEIITMKTTGDRILDRNLDQIGGKGLFVRELDQALLDRNIDLSIHSLKDLPMEIPKELPLVGFSKREEAADVLVLKKGMENIKFTGCIGTSSSRRRIQLEKLYPQAAIRGIRGNVQTRLRKLVKENYDATVLAKAGLLRLGLLCGKKDPQNPLEKKGKESTFVFETEEFVIREFTSEEMIPAAGQGILALQGRKGEDYSFLKDVCSEESKWMAKAERSFVKFLDGGCSSPVAAYARIENDNLILRGLYYHEEAGDFSVGVEKGKMTKAEEIGRHLAERLKREWI